MKVIILTQNTPSTYRFILLIKGISVSKVLYKFMSSQQLNNKVNENCLWLPLDYLLH